LERGERVYMAKILCIHVCEWENDTFESIPGMEAGWIKENDGGDEFNYDIFYIL
jgi:hypothetical protein